MQIGDAQTLTYFLIYAAGLMSGMWVPGRYLVERLEGAGRWLLNKFVPYEPPPGKERKEALREATGDETDEDENNGQEG